MEDFERVFQNLEEGRVRLKPLFTREVFFEDMIEEFPKRLDPETGVLEVMVNLTDQERG